MGKFTEREFRLGDFWLSKRPGRPSYYRTWYCNKTKQTKRVSLGTKDFEEAKLKLTEWYVQNHRPQKAQQEDVLLADVLHDYYENHAKHLRSAERARISLAYWLEYYETATIADIAPIAVQEGFHNWLRAKNQSEATISLILSAGRAAINRAWKRGELANVPFIHDVKVGRQPPKGRPLSIEEVAKLYKASSPHLQTFIMWMVGTCARPDAILELTWEQVDFENGLIHLNPPEREQTKKYRPTVRLPSTLAEFKPSGCRVVTYKGKPVASIKTAWRRARARAELDAQVNPYSLRHTMARWLRKQSVPMEEVALQLGHKVHGFSTTEIYTAYDPAYQENAVRAIELFFELLRAQSVPKP